MPEFESEIPKEETTDGESKEQEPTSQELAEVCKDILDEEACVELGSMEFEEALGFAFTCLIEAGINDPEKFLIEKGILEKPEK